MSLRTLSKGEVPADLDEFKEYLARFDWFSYMSDDPRYWAAGEEAEKKLTAFLNSEAAAQEHKQAYNVEHAKHLNTEFFVTAERPYQIPYP
jgi:hypothetical protein